MSALMENDKKNLFSTNVVTAFIKTGFPIFDYYFGSVVNVHNEMGQIIEQKPRLGQSAGTFNLLIGKSSSGKSTLAIQVASNIIRQFPNGNVIHFDCEQRTDVSRLENVSGFPAHEFEDGGRYILRSGAVGLDTIQETIVRLASSKIAMKKELTTSSGCVDEFGKDVKIIEPSVVIIDSIPSVLGSSVSLENSKDIADAETMRGNTEAAREARMLKGFLKDILPWCKMANIIVYAINHINVNMSMNAFTPVAKQHDFLKQDEAMPGGKALQYYSFNIIRLTAKPRDNFTEEKDGFDGRIVMVEPIKSSSNQSGNDSTGVSFEMIYSNKRGFDSLRSLIFYGRSRGIIEGNASRMKFIEDPSFTFTLKGLDQEKDEKPIWECIKKYIIPKLESHLSFIEPKRIQFDTRQMDY